MRRQKRQDDFESFSTRVGRASNDQTRVANAQTPQWRTSRLFALSIQLGSGPKRSVTYKQNDDQESSTVLIGLEFWRILVHLRGAVGRDVFTSRISYVFVTDMLRGCDEWLRYIDATR